MATRKDGRQGARGIGRARGSEDLQRDYHRPTEKDTSRRYTDHKQVESRWSDKGNEGGGTEVFQRTRGRSLLRKPRRGSREESRHLSRGVSSRRASHHDNRSLTEESENEEEWRSASPERGTKRRLSYAEVTKAAGVHQLRPRTDGQQEGGG